MRGPVLQAEAASRLLQLQATGFCDIQGKSCRACAACTANRGGLALVSAMGAGGR